MIGEQFAEPSEICGAVISVRQKGDRISLWTKTAANESAQARRLCLVLCLTRARPLPPPGPADARRVRRVRQLNLGKQLKSFLDISGHIGYLARPSLPPLGRRSKNPFFSAQYSLPPGRRERLRASADRAACEYPLICREMCMF